MAKDDRSNYSWANERRHSDRPPFMRKGKVGESNYARMHDTSDIYILHLDGSMWLGLNVFLAVFWPCSGDWKSHFSAEQLVRFNAQYAERTQGTGLDFTWEWAGDE